MPPLATRTIGVTLERMARTRTLLIVLPILLSVLTASFGVRVAGQSHRVGRAPNDDGSELQRAEGLLLRGKYAEAEAAMARLADRHPAAVRGQARAMAATGRDVEARRLLESRLGTQDNAMLLAEFARLAFARGDYDSAEKAVAAALKLHPDEPLARWILGELHRTAGRLDQADAEYTRLIRFYNGRPNASAESLRWIALAAARHARWNRLAGQFQFLVNTLLPSALKRRADFWPAHYEAGRLLLEKFNKSEADKELNAALKINPNAAEVHAALGELAMVRGDMASARQSAKRALEINPRELDAWLLRADLAWAELRPRESLRLLTEHALPLNPRAEHTLGRIAACHGLLASLRGGEHRDQLNKLTRQVTAANPHAGVFFHTAAGWLAMRHRDRQAERFYKEAVERMPQLPGPHAGLGMLWMRLGRIDQARDVFQRAFEADPFNVRVHNMLGVLEVLDEMKQFETEHFVIRYLPGDDELLARTAARYLEKHFDDWCRQFGYPPRGQTPIEIFATTRGASGEEWFAARMTGLPLVDALGGTTGWVVALPTPSEAHPRPFNWALVMRHEFAHVITLRQTRFNIPHWFTEGLAVYMEDTPRPPEWNALLIDRVAQEAVFDVESLNFAFLRPKSSLDRQMAYCQAELGVEYILRRWGSGGLRGLLDAYADGLATPAAIERTLGVPIEQFDAGFLRYVEQVADEIPRLAARDKRDEADKADGGSHKPAGDEFDAPDVETLLTEAQGHLAAERYDEAARVFRRGHQLDHTRAVWLNGLVQTYRDAEREEELADALRQLARRDPNDLQTRRELFKIALRRRDWPDVERWAGEALHVDVRDPAAHRALGEALVARRQYDRGVEQFQIAIQLDPTEPHTRFALADACLQTGQTAKAHEALLELLELVPDYPGAELLLEGIDQ